MSNPQLLVPTFPAWKTLDANQEMTRSCIQDHAQGRAANVLRYQSCFGSFFLIQYEGKISYVRTFPTSRNTM